jgi:hypothetical protein
MAQALTKPASQPSLALPRPCIQPARLCLGKRPPAFHPDQATIELAIPGGKIRQVILSYQSATDADLYIRIAGPSLADEPGAFSPETDRLIADQAPRDLQQAATVVEADVDQV